MDIQYAVEVYNLYKSYGSIRALNGINLNIKTGEIYGLIGPNGAGKTTTLKILAGLLNPDKGIIKIYGYDVVKERVKALRLIGYVPENPVVFQNLSIEEFIKFIAALRGINQHEIIDKLDYYLNIFNLDDKRKSLMGELSRGMIQKVLVTAAFIVRPRVLIMDEPMAGMDPESQHIFKEEVRKLVSEGITVMISSHLLDMVERFCTCIGIMYRGTLLVEGTVEEVKNRVSEAPGSTLEDVFLKIIRENI